MGYSLFILLFGFTSRCGGRLCFVQSRLLRARFIRAVEVQNSDPIGCIGVALFISFGPMFPRRKDS